MCSFLLGLTICRLLLCILFPFRGEKKLERRLRGEMNAGDDYPPIALLDLSLISFITQKFSHLGNVCRGMEHGTWNEHLAFYGTQYMCGALSIYRLFKKGARLHRLALRFFLYGGCPRTLFIPGWPGFAPSVSLR